MYNDDYRAIVLHNTYRIIHASRAACEMFHCEEEDLIDLDMIEIIADESLQGLAALRLKVMREMRDLRDQDLPLWRPDNTKFWATVRTRRLEEKLYQSELTYLHEMQND